MINSILAIPGAIAIGISLGLLGSGGSILTVPVLVYLVGQDEKVAIAGSLFIVGSIALAGSLQFLRAGLIQWRSVLIFGVPGMIGTWFGAFLATWIPGITQLALFAVVMLIASWLMLRPLDLDVLEQQSLALDWNTLMLITGLGIAGSFAGSYLAKRVPQDKLKIWFGYVLIVMGIYILVRSAPAAIGFTL